MRTRTLIAAFVASIALAACGGGGSTPVADIGGGQDLAFHGEDALVLDAVTGEDAPVLHETSPDVAPPADVPTTPDVPCVDECDEEGAARCYPDSPALTQRCVRGDDGCLAWDVPEECPSGQTCAAGVCEAHCVSDPGCEAVGDLRCASATTYHLCQEVETDCLKFGEAQSCPEFTLCTPGLGCVCDTEAAAACDTEGARSCFDDSTYRACERTAAGCLVWSAPRSCPDDGACVGDGQCETTCVSDEACVNTSTTRCYSSDEVATCEEVLPGCLQFGAPVPCPGALVCNEGVCEATCESDCPSVDAIGCLDAGHSRVCEDAGDGCLKWSEPTACAPHQACTDEVGCACDHACAVDETACSADDDTLQRVCVADDNECRYWQYRYCPASHVCADGECVAECVSDPGCTAEGVINCLSAAAYLVCEEVEAGCFQWGAPGGCGTHQACSEDGCECLTEEGCGTADLTVCASGTSFLTCTADDDGCLYWAGPQACEQDATCHAGACVFVCESDADCAAVGDARCTQDGLVQLCEEIEPGCIKWGEPAGCPDNQVCGDGAGCVCAQPCSPAGSQWCDEGGFLVLCEEDDNACTFESRSECSDDQSCVGSDCVLVTSPVVDCGTVVFNLVDRGFAEVLVVGDFNDWSETSTPLALEDGVWTVTIEVTEAGSPQYKFVVDGVFELDPLNPEHTDEGFFSNSILRVPVVADCELSGATRCGEAGDVQVCAEVEGCLTWTDALDPCMGPAEYCAEGACMQITSPVIVGDDITFTVRDEGYAGLLLAGDFTDPAWGVELPLTQDGNRWTLTIARSAYPTTLVPGNHEYKFKTAAGTWFFDPANPNAVDDGHGGVNSFFTLYETCENECEAADDTRCIGAQQVETCGLLDDGCLHWSESPCPDADGLGQYCLRNTCELFPVVREDGTVTFYVPEGDATTMDVAGDFNDPAWSNLPMSLVDGLWELTVGPLDPGSYQYKFIRDIATTQEWFVDPHNDRRVDNEMGGMNSYFEVP